jgi:DNA-binding CsgD family transcriptional regulator
LASTALWRAGRWDEAAQGAQDACARVQSRPAAGAAFYRLGEMHRRRGDAAKADASYTRASERGRKPQPGLALLRLAQGRIDAAAGSIRAALVDTRHRPARAQTLAAAVEILLAAGDLDSARGAAAELSAIAGAFSAPRLSATAAHAGGAVLLAEGELAGASTALRQACDLWRDLEMPYEESQTCRLLAAVCERLGDDDGRRLELESAHRLLEGLDAEWPVAGHAEPSPRGAHEEPGPLSKRELEVLRLLSTGKTNREIAKELFISEKTVARHVSNIFDKLGLSSRAAATAWAYQHHVL